MEEDHTSGRRSRGKWSLVTHRGDGRKGRGRGEEEKDRDPDCQLEYEIIQMQPQHINSS